MCRDEPSKGQTQFVDIVPGVMVVERDTHCSKFTVGAVRKPMRANPPPNPLAIGFEDDDVVP